MTVHHMPVTNPDVPDDAVSTHDLCRLAGLSFRRVDYYTRTGLLKPLNPTPGHGYPRYYADDQVVRARALRDLLDAGVSLVTCRDVVDELVEVGHVDVGHITLIHHPNGGDAA